ncbi:hypothetical protein [Paenibacillus sp. N3.4]|uniref:hypothetical protein n=1 Tax=Paenibacillus sp. N3.4 TaxID=2603222 RepID=UPI0011CB3792|nr:hypothetical protein [Paenibacillus sp. N3.4]TXK85114.1 hypothetical protein FU659_05040 [Paenibacillus sp. N3.4]
MIQKIYHLIRGDIKQIARDPMLFFYLLAPLLLLAGVRFGVPIVDEELQQRFHFDLSGYYDLIISFALLLVPLILGAMSGFMMLDERDENLINYYAVTPLTKRGYMWYRLSLTVVLTIIYSILLLLCSGLTIVNPYKIILLLSMLALEAPIFALFLAAYASNKVEGLALSKGASLLIFAPAIAYFIPALWQYLGGILPTYWISKTFLMGETADFMTLTLIACIGDVVHTLFFRYLYKRFMMKID